MPVLVEIWSDVVCPWCYIGKRQFEQALEQFPHRDQVEVVFRAYELDPTAPPVRDLPMDELLQRKYGMTAEQAAAANDRVTAIAAGVGLDYHLDKAQSGNTFDAHRLAHLAAARGKGDEAEERLMSAYFTDGAAIGERDTLERIGADLGLDPGEVRDVLDGDTYAAEVRADQREAAELGINGVPFFVLDRAYGVSGAQPPEFLLAALEQAWGATHPGDDGVGGPVPERTPAGDACDGDACAI